MKYFIILVLIIALPVFLYLKEEPEDPQFPLETTHTIRDGSYQKITILAHSKNYIQFIDEENSQFKGKLMTHILNKNDFSQKIRAEVSTYPESLEAPAYPCVIRMMLNDGSSFYANLVGKNSDLVYYTRDYKDVENNLKLTELTKETRRLLHYFPSNRRSQPAPKPKPKAKTITLPHSVSLSSSSGKIVKLTIHKRTKSGIIVSIKNRYDVHQIPFDKLSDVSQELVTRLPIDHAYSYDLTHLRKQYSFVKDRLDSKLKEQQKFEVGTFKYNALEKDIKVIKVKLSEITTKIESLTS